MTTLGKKRNDRAKRLVVHYEACCQQRPGEAVQFLVMMFHGPIWVDELVIEAGNDLDGEAILALIEKWKICRIWLLEYVGYRCRIKLQIGSWEGDA